MKNSKKLSFEEIDILKGLKNTTQKTINSKFFYNKRGSVLFEYLPSRGEIAFKGSDTKDSFNSKGTVSWINYC